LISKEYLPKETKYDYYNRFRNFYLNKSFIINNISGKEIKYFKYPLKSKDFSINIKGAPSDTSSSLNVYIFDYNTLREYNSYYSINDESLTNYKIFDFIFLESPIGFPIVNTSKGLFFFILIQITIQDWIEYLTS